ncbi:TPA: hypothetical protein R1734_001702, partial [Campylobacter lari]|nr:hypothetical protein [Campylobacter lari]
GIIFNQSFYYLLKDPKKHFAYDYHIAKELSLKLKQRNFTHIFTKDKELALRLKFYGISKGKLELHSSKKASKIYVSLGKHKIYYYIK